MLNLNMRMSSEKTLWIIVRVGDGIHRLFTWRSLAHSISSTWETVLRSCLTLTLLPFLLIVTSDLKRFQFNYEEEVQEEDKLHGKAKFLEVTFLIFDYCKMRLGNRIQAEITYRLINCIVLLYFYYQGLIASRLT